MMSSTIGPPHLRPARNVAPSNHASRDAIDARRPELYFDVLVGAFGYLGAQDLRAAAQVDVLWRAAATTGAILARWDGATDHAIDRYVRNKTRAIDVFGAQAPCRLFQDICARQRTLQLNDVDAGLNDFRVGEAFTHLPDLQRLRLRRSKTRHHHNAAVTCAPRKAQVHHKVLEQVVPPTLWTGALPPQLTHLDLSEMGLCASDEAYGRPVYETELLAGLSQAVAAHPNITHLTLGECYAEQVPLPAKLSHLTLTRSMRIQQAADARHISTLHLLAALPASLTHLHTNDKLAVAQLQADVHWPARATLQHLSISIDEDDLPGLNALLGASLVSLRLCCTQMRRMAHLGTAPAYPQSLRTLHIEMLHVSPIFAQRLLGALPAGLVSLVITASDVAALRPLKSSLAKMVGLARLSVRLTDPTDAACLTSVLSGLVPACGHITVRGIDAKTRFGA